MTPDHGLVAALVRGRRRADGPRSGWPLRIQEPSIGIGSIAMNGRTSTAATAAPPAGRTGRALGVGVVAVAGVALDRETPPVAEAAFPCANGCVVFQGNRDDAFEISSMPAVGGNQTRLTNDPRVDPGPAWAPDGARIVFLSFDPVSGSVHVARIAASGSDVKPLTRGRTLDWHPRWRAKPEPRFAPIWAEGPGDRRDGDHTAPV